MKKMMILCCVAGVLSYTSACNSNQKAENDQNTPESPAMVSPGQENLAANEAPTTSNPSAGRETRVENSDVAMQPGAGNASTGEGNMTAETFVKEAASGGMMEVVLGKLASQKAKNQQVKEFGQMMVTDHSKANEQLKSIASKKNIAVPAQMMEEHQQHVDELSKLSGSEFDTHYMQMMVQDHQEDINKFQQASTSIQDAEIKSFATNTLPVLKQHHQRAQQITSTLEGGTARSNNP